MNFNHTATPNDSRYVPFTQQDYCCVPTCMQMIMYKNGIPLIPAEVLGYYFGLTVPPEDAHLFFNPRISDTPPTSGGYGTQIPKFDPNKVFEKLGIPLTFFIRPATEMSGGQDLLKVLRIIEKNDSDALLCFNHGIMRGEYKKFTGHVVVFDRVIDGKVRIIDASYMHPKWRLVKPTLLHDAMIHHDSKSSAGIWHFKFIQ